MSWPKALLVTVLLAVVVGTVLLYRWGERQREPFTEAAIRRDLALQQELPGLASAEGVQSSAPEPQANLRRNLYFGELHLHTEQSFDAALFGNTLTIADAYRFARGEALLNNGGELMQLSRPLDFVAITDHAEGFGSRRNCGQDDLPWRAALSCLLASTPNLATFEFLRKFGGKAGSAGRENSPYCQAVGVEQCLQDAIADWSDYQRLADQYNEPGVFTAIKAYEYSPTLPDGGKYHRNVFFRGDTLPALAVSMMDAPTAPELWKSLEANCREDCEFLTIPHNMNRAWGLPYGLKTRLGENYTAGDWALRAKYEPLAEIYQVKGASECALGAFAIDEECDFEQILPLCEPGQQTGCAMATGFAREGLKIGLRMEQKFGMNPFQFGFVAATDSHNSNPGDTEEWDFRGYAGPLTAPAKRRQTHLEPGRGIHHSVVASRSPGGLAAIWAPENTRDALFHAMQARETYGTSGTRIRLRFFAGRDLDEALLEQADPLPAAYAAGVPMGGELTGNSARGMPTFFVWAQADPDSAPLQRLQIVKGWVEAGATREQVVDIACADGLQVDTASGRCPDNGATVDPRSCEVSAAKGATELKTLWRDPEFDPSQAAFYYVRVLENPTCRWTTYDALRLGIEPTPYAPPLVRERAWSSPIWYRPQVAAPAAG